ncbi:MAG: hypothetical protein WC471_03800 [Candidatus Woesearchaeota archaeon]
MAGFTSGGFGMPGFGYIAGYLCFVLYIVVCAAVIPWLGYCCFTGIPFGFWQGMGLGAFISYLLMLLAQYFKYL